jgi:phosphoglycolate phosphatase
LENLFSLNYSVGIATSKPTELAKKTLAFSDLNYFPLHIQGTENFPPKPNPEILHILSTHFKKARIKVMIGDRREDIYTGINFGVATIGVAQTSHNELELKNAGADLVFSNMAKFFESFENILELIDPARL